MKRWWADAVQGTDIPKWMKQVVRQALGSKTWAEGVEVWGTGGRAGMAGPRGSWEGEGRAYAHRARGFSVGV